MERLYHGTYADIIVSYCAVCLGCILSSLRPLDVEFMKALHEKVNIVPVLAKADTLTPSEVKKKKFKARLLPVNDAVIHTCVIRIS